MPSTSRQDVTETLPRQRGPKDEESEHDDEPVVEEGEEWDGDLEAHKEAIRQISRIPSPAPDMPFPTDDDDDMDVGNTERIESEESENERGRNGNEMRRPPSSSPPEKNFVTNLADIAPDITARSEASDTEDLSSDRSMSNGETSHPSIPTYTPSPMLRQPLRVLSYWFFDRVFHMLWLIFSYCRLSYFFPDIDFAVSREIQRFPDYYEVREAVFQSEEVRRAIGYDRKTTVSLRRGVKVDSKTINQGRLKEAQQIYATMAAHPRPFVLRILSYLFRKVWAVLYVFGIHVPDEDIEVVRNASGRAALVLPTHKSHVDYMIVTYMCIARDLPIPYVIAGDNLNIPIIGRVLRWGGAIFIRRSFGGDSLYKAVFGEYIRQILKREQWVECFIEGGRSRSGKVLPPKIGLLLQAVDVIIASSDQDIQAIPVSIGYDRLVENESHLHELSGGRKKQERLFSTIGRTTQLMTSAFTMVTCYGRVDIRLARPFSVRDFVLNKLGMEVSGPLGVVNGDMKKNLAYSLGYQVLYDCNRVSVVEPAAIIATVLMTHYSRAISKEDLTKEAFWLCDAIKERGGETVPLTLDSIDLVVDLVLENIVSNNKLVKRHKNLLLISLYSPKERLELSQYRNQLLHHFVAEGLIALAMYTATSNSHKRPGERDVGPAKAVDDEKLFKMTDFLSRLLKIEFIYKPSPKESTASAGRHNFEETLAEMLDRGIFERQKDGKLVISSESGTLMHLFLCALFWHFIDSYWLAAIGFLALLPDVVKSEDVLLDDLQEFGEYLYFEGQLDLYEAISRETLTNAITRLEDWGVIEFLYIQGQHASSSPGKRLIRLSPAYQDESVLEDFIYKLGRYRKRSRAYRSRRYQVRNADDITDSIQAVRRKLALRAPSSRVFKKKNWILDE